MNINKSRAFLKWAGGKYSLIEEIQRQLPTGNRLIEPFVGAGSVFLNTDYDRYLLCDINSDLIHLYKIVQSDTNAFLSASEPLFTGAYNQSDKYYELRTEFNQTTDSFRRSVLFLYLNRHGYNGLCRYNKSGGFNVPFGRYKAPYFPEKEIEFFAQRAKKATFECIDFQRAFARARKGNVIYCDPPYAPISETANFTHYAKTGFDYSQQASLALLAERAGRKGIPTLVSNHDTPTTRQLYHSAQLHELKVSRFISQKGYSRKKVSELMALYCPRQLSVDHDADPQQHNDNKAYASD